MTTPDGQNQRQPPWHQESESPEASFGTWLRRQREMREITLREISDVTRISMRYLEALEQDRFDVLPAEVFAKGFLREYAGYVGLDPDEVVNSYLTALQEVDGEDEPAVEEPARKGASLEWTSGMLLILLVIALVALVAFLAFYAERSRSASQPEPSPIAAPPMEPAPTPSPVQESTEVEPALLVTMDFTQDCWVEIEADGVKSIGELHPQGESIRIGAEERVLLTLGNADGVRIEVNGRPFAVPEGSGDVARDIEITLADLPAEETEPQLEEAPEPTSTPDSAVPEPGTEAPVE